MLVQLPGWALGTAAAGEVETPGLPGPRSQILTPLRDLTQLAQFTKKFFTLQSKHCQTKTSPEEFCSVLITRDEVLDGKTQMYLPEIWVHSEPGDPVHSSLPTPQAQPRGK